jgi:tetratricopeptide (TPR) repeat protein
MRTALTATLLAALSLASQACSGEIGSPVEPAPPPQDGKTVPAAEGAPDRSTPASSRTTAALEAGIAMLEKRLASLPADSADRVTLARELAEQNAGLEIAAFREKVQAKLAGDLHRESDAGAVMIGARAAAMKYYDSIIRDYPSYPQIDEVFYYLAYEYEQADDLPHARMAYHDLIQRRPDSKYVPNAYLAFGEQFFAEVGRDPSKLELAKAAYAKVLEYPPPGNQVYGYACYKLAYIYWNMGELDRALDAFKKTIAFGLSYPEVPNAVKVAERARRDVVPVYANAGRPKDAYGFFRTLDDKSGRRTFEMMAALGQTYLETGHNAEALALYEDLLGRAPDSEVSVALGKLVSAANASGDTATADRARALLTARSSRARTLN